MTDVYTADRLRVAQQALSRLAAAMVLPEDEACTVEAVIDLLSERDCAVLVKVLSRVAEIEARDGSEAAERALDGVLAILSQGRVLA
jgi:hypothetical protein